ncbi:E3 ubiquitin-protein ligase TRIM45 isoform X2 [Dermacentor variabilis]|uniref:E3 ubiquitin-protein ligase TRIM45 isoform X2 n=1 Tax=Dermacentor variabilis TaxID=34621 RepID=UPI003F5BF5B1
MSRPANNEFKYKARDRQNPLSLQCPACLEKLQDPRILPCLHTLCRRCIERLGRYHRRFLSSRVSTPKGVPTRASCTRGTPSNELSATPSCKMHDSAYRQRDGSVEEKADGVIVCPTCQNECTVTATGNEFPANFLVRRFLRSAPDLLGSWQPGSLKQSASQTKRSSLCDLCAKSRAAVNRCVGCLLSCCTRLRRHHTSENLRGRSAARKTHEADEQTMQSTASPGPRACSKHPAYQVDTFCLSCRKAICSSCLLNDHRNHVSSDLSAAKEKELMRTGQLLTRLHSKMSTLEDSANGTLKKSQALSRNASDVTREVNSFYDGYVCALEARRRELLDEIARFQKENQQTLLDRSSTLEAALVRAKSVHEFGKTLLHFGPEMPEVVLPLVEVLDKAARPIVVMDDKEDISMYQPLSLRFRKDREDHREGYLVYGAVSRQADPSTVSAVLSFEDPADSQQLGSLKAVRLKFQDPSGHPIDVEPEQVRAMLISSKSARKTAAVVTRAEDDPLQLRLKFDTRNAGTHALAVTLDDQPLLGSPFLFRVRSRKPRCEGRRCPAAPSLDRTSACRASASFQSQSLCKRQRIPGDSEINVPPEQTPWSSSPKPFLQSNLNGSDIMTDASSRSSRLYQFTT